MKTVKVSELKARLSEYLRMAAAGRRLVVTDREDPIAQLGPLDAVELPWRDRLVREGRLRPGTQDWGSLKISPTNRPVDVQGALRAIRDDPDEVRRR